MLTPTRRRGALRISIALTTAALALRAASGLAMSPLPALVAGPGRDVADWVRLHADLRWGLERSAVALQVLAVATLCLSRFLRPCFGAEVARRGFVASMIGLGAVGVGCAGYASPFALYAGGTMAVLLNVVIMGHQPRAVVGGYVAV